jgi:hypothetical protein
LYALKLYLGQVDSAVFNGQEGIWKTTVKNLPISTMQATSCTVGILQAIKCSSSICTKAAQRQTLIFTSPTNNQTGHLPAISPLEPEQSKSSDHPRNRLPLLVMAIKNPSSHRRHFGLDRLESAFLALVSLVDASSFF